MDTLAFVSNNIMISNLFLQDILIFLKSIACESKFKYLPVKPLSMLLTMWLELITFEI